jgi:hypothetical protein
MEANSHADINSFQVPRVTPFSFYNDNIHGVLKVSFLPTINSLETASKAKRNRLQQANEVRNTLCAPPLIFFR